MTIETVDVNKIPETGGSQIRIALEDAIRTGRAKKFDLNLYSINTIASTCTQLARKHGVRRKTRRVETFMYAWFEK